MIQIHSYKPGHHKEIANLFHDTIHAVCRNEYTPEQLEAWAPTPVDYEKWRLRCEKKQPFLAMQNDKIVGFAELEEDGHIDCFYVHKDHQKQGVGSMLFEQIETIRTQKNLKKLYAEVSLTAKAFFEKKGFQVLRKNIVQINDQELINFIMEKEYKNSPLIHLRPATPADLPLLQYWDEQQHVIDSDPDDDWGWETELARNPEWREQLVAELDGRPIGFIQIIDPALEESHYWGEVEENMRAIDIWIGEENDLGKGYGTEMMRQAIERCFARPNVTAILIDPLFSNTRARRFYERLGFKFVERRQFGESDCAVYRLNRNEWKR